MLYETESAKNVDDAVRDLEAAVARHGFGVLHRYDFEKTLAEKGFPLGRACRVLEICSPRDAVGVLGTAPRMAPLLPCRIAVYDADGGTHIGAARPTAMIGGEGTAPALAAVAADVERRMIAAIDEAR